MNTFSAQNGAERARARGFSAAKRTLAREHRSGTGTADGRLRLVMRSFPLVSSEPGLSLATEHDIRGG